MYSLHLTGSPWFLLLIPVGLWILWQANSSGGGGGAGSGKAGRILFGLQALALLLMALSMAGPELRRHHVRFHNPAILILRDQSASFRAGATLGLGSRYADFQRRLGEAYTARGFEVRVADFAAAAWPVSGFPHASRPPAQAAGDPTSLSAAAAFADSAAIPNLQAVFLFSDGRAVLDSGRSASAWRVPVYPVMFSPDSIAEAQPLSVTLDPGGVEAKWEPVGRLQGDPRFRLLQGSRVLLNRTLPASALADADGARSFRFPWAQPAGAGTSGPSGPLGPLRAVLQPASAASDFDPWNDTLAVGQAGTAGVGRVFVLKPVRSLDERGMLDALRSEGNLEITFFAAGNAPYPATAPADQIWLEAGETADAKLLAWLRRQPGKVVLYARSGEDGFAYPAAAARTPSLPGLAEGAWPGFSAAAEIKPAKIAADVFPDEVVRLKSLSPDPIRAPSAPAATATAGGAWVEIKEGGKRGMLMGRVELGQGKRAFFFCLPAIWGGLFDPQGDFAARENIGAYVRAAHALAGLEEGAARVSLPHRVIAGHPFDIDIDLPEATRGEAAFGLAGPGFSREWPRPAALSAGQGWTAKALAVPEGRYRAWVRAGADTLWRDSLAAAPPEALELARLGFAAASLADLAERSGGSVLRPIGMEVTSLLPQLPAAQIRMDRTASTRFYNTLPLCLIILALLGLAWVLRKKWDFD
jgi:hypothetical protein